jgi:transmembrane sensor
MKSMTNDYIGLLISKYLNDTLEENEQQDLEQWLNGHPANRQKFEELTNPNHLSQKMRDWNAISADEEAVWQKIEAKVMPYAKQKSLVKRMGVVKVAAAAVILILGSIVIYYMSNRKLDQKTTETAPIAEQVQDIAPGGNKAVLTLEDGSTIVLDNKGNGVIAEQGQTTINKKQDGELVYNASSPERSRRTGPGALSAVEERIKYNTITTPRGGQYQLTLPDGTKAWLNAASSLKFPVRFSGNKRVVELSGEGYFEVATVRLNSGQKMPFEVHVNNGLKVEVLGTHFNIMAYAEENEAKTTLIEGSVKVLTGAAQQAGKASAAVYLKPGQQALLSNEADNLRVKKDANIEEAIAWKNGKFKFERADLHTVMRSMARWYNVEFEIDKDVPEKFFKGEISRELKASEALSIIEFAGIHWKIEGKKIRVMP